MSHLNITWGRFPDVDHTSFDEETRSLYRSRDLEIDPKDVMPFSPSQCLPSPYFGRLINPIHIVTTHRATDPAYYKMTEQERVENGLPTRSQYMKTSITGMLLTTIFGAFSMSQFNKIYSPSGIILRNTAKVSLFRKIS